MNLLERFEGSLLVLSVVGRLDNTASDHFRERALQHIRDGVRFIIVDFGQTDYIASMGIRALFIPTRELTNLQGNLVLSGLNRDLQSLLNTAGLLDLYTVFPTVDAAIADSLWQKAG